MPPGAYMMPMMAPNGKVMSGLLDQSLWGPSSPHPPPLPSVSHFSSNPLPGPGGAGVGVDTGHFNSMLPFYLYGHPG